MRTWLCFAALTLSVVCAGAATSSKKVPPALRKAAASRYGSKRKPAPAKSKGAVTHARSVPHSTQPPRQAAPTNERYREIQEALAKKGYLTTEPNGVWDQNSQDAMKRFQSDQKLDSSGKLTSRSIIALGLGSSTAGPPSAPKL